MDAQELIIIDVFCKECNVEVALLEELEDFGLIEMVNTNGLKYINSQQWPKVQKIIHFHNELNINKEGIEVVLQLLGKLDKMNQDIYYLKQKLNLYE